MIRQRGVKVKTIGELPRLGKEVVLPTMLVVPGRLTAGRREHGGAIGSGVV